MDKDELWRRLTDALEEFVGSDTEETQDFVAKRVSEVLSKAPPLLLFDVTTNIIFTGERKNKSVEVTIRPKGSLFPILVGLRRGET